MPGIGQALGGIGGTLLGGPAGTAIGAAVGGVVDNFLGGLGGQSPEEIAKEEAAKREAYYQKNGHYPEEPVPVKPGHADGTFKPGAGPSGDKWTGKAADYVNTGVTGGVGTGAGNPPTSTTGGAGLPSSGGAGDSAGKWYGTSVGFPTDQIMQHPVFIAVGIFVLLKILKVF